MKKRFIRLSLVGALIGLLVWQNFPAIKELRNPVDARAFGELQVDFGVPAGTPLFQFTNIAPGNVFTKTVNVENTGGVDRLVAVKGVKTSETGNLASVLSVVISENGTDVYGGTTGAKHLSDFFTDSNTEDGVVLTVVPSGDEADYVFTVTFDASAGNEFQNTQLVFDLTFGVINGNNLIINEVFYNVDAAHGNDSSSSTASLSPTLSSRLRRDIGRRTGNNEWIELFNPTDQDITIRNYTLSDNQGTLTLNRNRRLRPGQFALIYESNHTWQFWSEGSAMKIRLADMGHLDTNDHLILKDPSGAVVDALSWGTDTSVFSLPSVAPGHSLSRVSPGQDTDSAADWFDDATPSPGN